MFKDYGFWIEIKPKTNYEDLTEMVIKPFYDDRISLNYMNMEDDIGKAIYLLNGNTFSTYPEIVEGYIQRVGYWKDKDTLYFDMEVNTNGN